MTLAEARRQRVIFLVARTGPLKHYRCAVCGFAWASERGPTECPEGVEHARRAQRARQRKLAKELGIGLRGELRAELAGWGTER